MVHAPKAAQLSKLCMSGLLKKGAKRRAGWKSVSPPFSCPPSVANEVTAPTHASVVVLLCGRRKHDKLTVGATLFSSSLRGQGIFRVIMSYSRCCERTHLYRHTADAEPKFRHCCHSLAACLLPDASRAGHHSPSLSVFPVVLARRLDEMEDICVRLHRLMSLLSPKKQMLKHRIFLDFFFLILFAMTCRTCRNVGISWFRSKRLRSGFDSSDSPVSRGVVRVKGSISSCLCKVWKTRLVHLSSEGGETTWAEQDVKWRGVAYLLWLHPVFVRPPHTSVGWLCSASRLS